MRAGTGGDEAGLWAGDLVGTCLFCLSKNMRNMPCYHRVEHQYKTNDETGICLSTTFFLSCFHLQMEGLQLTKRLLQKKILQAMNLFSLYNKV